MIVELHWTVLSKRYPEVDQRVFEQILETIRHDPALSLQPVTPEIAEKQGGFYNKLSFFDAYYAAFSLANRVKLLTTDTDFQEFDFAEVID